MPEQQQNNRNPNQPAPNAIQFVTNLVAGMVQTAVQALSSNPQAARRILEQLFRGGTASNQNAGQQPSVKASAALNLSGLGNLNITGKENKQPPVGLDSSNKQPVSAVHTDFAAPTGQIRQKSPPTQSNNLAPNLTRRSVDSKIPNQSGIRNFRLNKLPEPKLAHQSKPAEQTRPVSYEALVKENPLDNDIRERGLKIARRRLEKFLDELMDDPHYKLPLFEEKVRHYMQQGHKGIAATLAALEEADGELKQYEQKPQKERPKHYEALLLLRTIKNLQNYINNPESRNSLASEIQNNLDHLRYHGHKIDPVQGESYVNNLIIIFGQAKHGVYLPPVHGTVSITRPGESVGLPLSYVKANEKQLNKTFSQIVDENKFDPHLTKIFRDQVMHLMRTNPDNFVVRLKRNPKVPNIYDYDLLYLRSPFNKENITGTEPASLIMSGSVKFLPVQTEKRGIILGASTQSETVRYGKIISLQQPTDDVAFLPFSLALRIPNLEAAKAVHEQARLMLSQYKMRESAFTRGQQDTGLPPDVLRGYIIGLIARQSKFLNPATVELLLSVGAGEVLTSKEPDKFYDALFEQFKRGTIPSNYDQNEFHIPQQAQQPPQFSPKQYLTEVGKKLFVNYLENGKIPSQKFNIVRTQIDRYIDALPQPPSGLDQLTRSKLKVLFYLAALAVTDSLELQNEQNWSRVPALEFLNELSQRNNGQLLDRFKGISSLLAIPEQGSNQNWPSINSLEDAGTINILLNSLKQDSRINPADLPNTFGPLYNIYKNLLELQQTGHKPETSLAPPLSIPSPDRLLAPLPGLKLPKLEAVAHVLANTMQSPFRKMDLLDKTSDIIVDCFTLATKKANALKYGETTGGIFSYPNTEWTETSSQHNKGNEPAALQAFAGKVDEDAQRRQQLAEEQAKQFQQQQQLDQQLDQQQQVAAPGQGAVAQGGRGAAGANVDGNAGADNRDRRNPAQ